MMKTSHLRTQNWAKRDTFDASEEEKLALSGTDLPWLHNKYTHKFDDLNRN